MAIENLAIFVEKHCAKLTENIPTKINDSYHINDIFEALDAKGNLIMLFSCLSTMSICFVVLAIIQRLLL